MKNWEKSNCWIWPFSKNKDGYGQITKNKKYNSAHKWVYEQLIGNVPHGCELDHLCKNTACVNPFHLEPVSHAENCRRGNNHKLKAEDVVKIKKLAGKESQKKIAEKFGVSRALIGLILQGKRWN